jgi:signal transduction histidine kinase
MPTFDARTVVLVTFLTDSLLFIILFALSRGVARSLSGLSYGVLAALAWSIGSGLIMGRGAIPNAISVGVGNVAITGGFLLIRAALKLSSRDVEQREDPWLVGAAVIGVAVTVTLVTLGNYSHLVFFFTGCNTLACLLCVAAACQPKPVGLARGFTAIALAVGATASAIRFAFHAMGTYVATEAFDPSFLQQTYFSLMAFSLLSTLLGFTLITYERLNKMLSAANTVLETEVAARTADLTAEIVRKQALERLLSSAAEAERRRIGHELHDDLGQRLTGISLVAEALARELEITAKPLAAHADAIQRAASDAISQVRGLAHGLMPVAPEPEGFSAALTVLANDSTIPGLVCKFEFDEPVGIKNQDVATNLYRIAQEALSNAIRHAKATKISIRLYVAQGKVHFSVADNGTGFELPRATPAGVVASRGLGIMEFRAALIQYRLEIDSSIGHGSIVRVIEC